MIKEATALFRRQGGIMRMTAAIKSGIHRRTLYAMRDHGVLELMSRGLYRLADAPPLASPDLVAVAQRVPRGVICLISALAFHDLTTQIPHEVYLAVSRDSEPPRVDYPPVRVFRFAGPAYSAGIEKRDIDGARVQIFSREKTLADCFKYRNKIGLDTAVEALKRYKQQGRIDAEALLRHAQTCRVAKVIRPYLEAIL
jgi:predicted transcriptional regulator of viral defense system